MEFIELCRIRESCRSYDKDKIIADNIIDEILECARLSPSACNGQPYHITVCRGDAAEVVAKATQGMGMNKFTADVPVMIVISEKPYNSTAAVGSKVKHNDYRSIDIGIVSAYITAEACAQGLSTCILGWLDDKEIRKICSLSEPVRLVIALGYASENDKLREKKRKDLTELVTFK